jgi:peptide chain release factor 1
MTSYLDKLDDIEARYEQIMARMGDGSLKPHEFQKLAQEESGLRPMIEAYRKLKKVRHDLDNAKHLAASETDSELRELALEEMRSLDEQKIHLERDLKIFLLPKDPNDDKNIYLEIRAGTGGDEAGLFVSDLFRMYKRYAEKKTWSVEILSANATGVGGFKEIIALVSGQSVYSHLKFESGVHRVQRVPDTEAQGRIHTSAVSVAIMPEVEDVEVEILDKDLRIDVFRAGGAGGQHVNTTDSAVRITHIPSGLVVSCQDEKSQHKNKAKGLKILKARLYDHMLQEQLKTNAELRKMQVGSGDRSEKIRTYNFPQGRVSDHRINLTLYQIELVMNGDLDLLVDPLRTTMQTMALQAELSQ